MTIPPSAVTSKVSLTAVPKASLGMEDFIQMSLWRGLAPAGHVLGSILGVGAEFVNEFGVRTEGVVRRDFQGQLVS